jgi:hypothetical protein
MANVAEKAADVGCN